MLFPNESTTPLLNLTTIKGRDLEKYNLIKYRMICAILDFFAIGKQVDYYPGKYNIRKMLISNGIISTSKNDKAVANAAFAEMCMMGLVVENSENITLTPYAIEAYKANTFHQICASLTAADEARKIGARTMWVTILALIISLVSLLIAFIK
ncbi:MAG: hypothetical protein JFR38_03270 [Muribaculaceae bacterium]|nr:hypothetical protein [Muribaculaceae bacterium]